jgi:hypothetical protein
VSNRELQVALKALFEAIAARDTATVQRLLGGQPELAQVSCATGATRQEPKSYFFEAITHYAYEGDTALHLAAAAHVEEVVDDLIRRRADMRARNRRGAEPLHYAADGMPGSAAWHPVGQAAVVRALIRAGADPNAEDASGVVPLHRAVRTRCAAAVEALLEGGADVRRRNRSGTTALELAQRDTGRGGSGSPEAREQQARIVELLRAHSATSRS